MGLYDQALALNQQGQNTALQLRQQALGQPTAIQRFMSGLKGGQEQLTAQKQSALQEMLARAQMEERNRKAMQDQEQYEYGKTQRPIAEQGALTDILFKQKQAERMGQPQVEGGMTEFQRANLDLAKQKFEWDKRNPGPVARLDNPLTAPSAVGSGTHEGGSLPVTAR